MRIIDDIVDFDIKASCTKLVSSMKINKDTELGGGLITVDGLFQPRNFLLVWTKYRRYDSAVISR
jgi:hypothetical protein